MDSASASEGERRDLRGLVERIKRGDCVLVLGPRLAVRPDDPNRQTLDEALARDLLARIDAPAAETSASPVKLRRACDLYYAQRQDREELELVVQEFYQRHTEATTDFHRDLAQLPFKLCISASPDDLFVTALKAVGKSPLMAHYGFKGIAGGPLAAPTGDKPLVYYLFGHHEDPGSLVLTDGDLIEFLVSVVRGTPALPDQVRSVLADRVASFLFIGFGFQNWYLRVLLHVMSVYGHRSKPIAFEDTNFFNDPEHQQAVGFFSGERLIDFQPLRWDGFARELREAYEASTRKVPPPPASVSMRQSLGAAPKAFLSYASEDLALVEALREHLEAQGIRVWEDQQNLRAGDDWNRVLLDVIGKKVDYVIAVQTPTWSTRISGVFAREIKAAQRRQEDMLEFDGARFRFLLPVRIGAVDLLSDFKNLHVIDVSQASGVSALIESIKEDWERRAAKLNARGTAAV